ncbi:MAG: phosphoribosylglycinamide formyltransferase [Chloroflexi bacterium]|nr:MAG: phosphoribosylglycinamide formyltransferase [Chloroflexota bacterium]TMF77766.1 MAG: phosphoribosylglycinamide formyltransferase [Chloroflexota bacterium]TMF78455.1 MAG: phosphoribosylglycinamide formyltransferase [Chloroflexota bacterium]TMF92282.1 MAG: phosphoribosylglycinamide formyltransferase [Chloroflexota bacterium]
MLRAQLLKIGVAVSGQGSNLRNLVERGFEVVAVATNRPSCGAAAFARQRGIALAELPQKAFDSAEQRDVAMRDFFAGRGVELVVDAGFDRIHTRPFLEAFQNRIINVHPSLLPEFAGGMDALEQALASGVRRTGATVHIVTADLDAGPILLQESVPILDGDTVETLRERVHEAEHRILPQAIRLMETRIANSPSVR